MSIKNLREAEITNNPVINSNFLSVYREQLKLDCKNYKGNFYADSFNFFPITTDDFSFLELFMWGDKIRYKNRPTTTGGNPINALTKTIVIFFPL